jgi:hypothetical protein
MIDAKDISVIVQGHVRGLHTDPPGERWTWQALHSVRRWLPGAEIILSTFRESDITDLPCDVIVLNDDPGWLDLSPVNRLVGNTNRQIGSTLAGLRRASRPYALKMRYDLVLHGHEFLSYFGRFRERAADWRIFSERVVSCTSVSLNPRKRSPNPLAPSDWFHFGWRDDLLRLWDIPFIPPLDAQEADTLNPQRWIRDIHCYSAEQYIWVSCLRKKQDFTFRHSRDASDRIVALSELSIANNFVLLEPEQISLVCKKYEDKNRLTYSKHLNYTYAEWLHLYRHLCGGSSDDETREETAPKNRSPANGYTPEVAGKAATVA